MLHQHVYTVAQNGQTETTAQDMAFDSHHSTPTRLLRDGSGSACVTSPQDATKNYTL